MPRKASVAKDLQSAVAQLQSQRQQHVQALTEIDAVLARIVIQPQPAKRRGRPPKAQAQTTGQTIGASAAPNARGRRTTAEINKHRKMEHRSGNAYVSIRAAGHAEEAEAGEPEGGGGSRYKIV